MRGSALNQSSVFRRRWWPLTQSFDLVECSCDDLSLAILREVDRYTHSEQGIICKTEKYHNINSVFASVTNLTNVPTMFYIIPTKSIWSVLWSNSYLCDGYDSLCSNLTERYGYATVHFSSHDDTTTFLPGSTMVYRRSSADGVLERRVQASIDDNDKWYFSATGPQQDFELHENYAERKIKNRLKEEVMERTLRNMSI